MADPPVRAASPSAPSAAAQAAGPQRTNAPPLSDPELARIVSDTMPSEYSVKGEAELRQLRAQYEARERMTAPLTAILDAIGLKPGASLDAVKRMRL